MEKTEKDLIESFDPCQYKSLRCSCSFSVWFFFSVQGGLSYLPSIFCYRENVVCTWYWECVYTWECTFSSLFFSDYTKRATYVAGVFHFHAESLGQLINPSLQSAWRTSRRDASLRLAWRIMQAVKGQSLISSSSVGSFVLSRGGIGSCFLGALAHGLHALDWEDWPGSGGEYASSRLASLKATVLRQLTQGVTAIRESDVVMISSVTFSPINAWRLPPRATVNLGSQR